MEIEQKEYVKQLYQTEIENILRALIRIEVRLTELKLNKFSICVKALTVALSIEELNKSKVLLKAQEKPVQKIAKELLNFKSK